MPKKTANNKQPATKADVDKAVGELAIATQKGFSHVDEQFTDIRNDISGMKDDISGMKDDISSMKDDISGMKDDISGTKNDITGLKNSQSAILDVVKSIDHQLKTHKNLPARVDRLERAVFR